MPDPGSWGRFRWPFGERHEDVRLSALLDDELDEDGALEVTRHVVRCEPCRRELEAIRGARLALRGLPSVDPPRELFAQVLAQPPALDGPPRARRLAAAVATSAALLGAAAFFAGGGDDPGTVSPPVQVFVIDHVARMDGGPVLNPVDFGR